MHFLFFDSCALNPFLYAGQNKEMRESMFKLFSPGTRRRRANKLSIYRSGRQLSPANGMPAGSSNRQLLLAPSQLSPPNDHQPQQQQQLAAAARKKRPRRVKKHARDVENCSATECQGTPV